MNACAMNANMCAMHLRFSVKSKIKQGPTEGLYSMFASVPLPRDGLNTSAYYYPLIVVLNVASHPFTQRLDPPLNLMIMMMHTNTREAALGSPMLILTVVDVSDAIHLYPFCPFLVW
jgi:hypothetical protein